MAGSSGGLAGALTGAAPQIRDHMRQQTPHQQPTAAQAPAPHRGPNVFDQSAGAYSSALGTAGQAAQAANQIGGGVNFTPMGAPTQTASAGSVTAGQLADTNLDSYMNPFTQSVIDTSVSDLERARQQAMIQMGGSASAANAFGGSRHGVAMGETNRAYDDNMGRMIAGLNMQNFGQAREGAQFDIGSSLQADQGNQASRLQSSIASMQNATQRDIANQNAELQAAALSQQGFGNQASQLAGIAGMQGNLANLGFGFGQQSNQMMQQSGAQQQAHQQALLDQAMGQYGGYTGSPMNSLGAMSQALGATPQPGRTTTNQPGLFDYLTMGAGVMGAMCWVAREVYGPENPAWLEFREWMLGKAPAWLRKAYIKHGPKWAEWVKRNPWSKRVLRPLMDMVR